MLMYLGREVGTLRSTMRASPVPKCRIKSPGRGVRPQGEVTKKGSPAARGGSDHTDRSYRGYFWFDLSSAAGSFSASAWLRRSTMRSFCTSWI